MGTSKRYAAAVDAAMDHRILQRTMTGEPETLLPTELELDTEPLTRPPKPRPVRAWVRYDGTPISVDAEAVAWTARAVAIRWRSPSGEPHRAWVWVSAIRPR